MFLFSIDIILEVFLKEWYKTAAANNVHNQFTKWFILLGTIFELRNVLVLCMVVYCFVQHPDVSFTFSSHILWNFTSLSLYH